KTLGAGETDSVPFISGSIENFDSFRGHHADELGFLPAFVVVIAEHGHRWSADTHQHVDQRFHLFRPAKTRQVACNDENISLVAHMAELLLQDTQRLCAVVQIGSGSNSHFDRLPVFSLLRGGADHWIGIARQVRYSLSRLSSPHSLTSIANM